MVSLATIPKEALPEPRERRDVTKESSDEIRIKHNIPDNARVERKQQYGRQNVHLGSQPSVEDTREPEGALWLEILVIVD